MTRPAMRLRIVPRFPARILATDGLKATRSGGAVTIGQDWTPVQETALPGTPANYDVLFFNRGDKSYSRVPADQVITPGADWSTLPGKPSTFPPSAHSHPISQVTDLQTELDAKLASSAATASGLAMLGAASAAAQTALLSNFVGDSGSGGTKGLVPAPSAGSASSGFYLSAAGTWGLPAGMATGYASRAAAEASTIPAYPDYIQVAGFGAANDSPFSVYARVSEPSPVEPWHFQSSDGAYWELRAFPAYSSQLGCLADGTTDDTDALQAWSDYAAAFKVEAVLSPGVHAVPSGTIALNTSVYYRGADATAEIRRTSDVVAPLYEASSKSNVQVSGIKFTFGAGLTSSSSITISAGSKVWTVSVSDAAGFEVGDYIMATAQADQRNIIVAQITDYSGTTLTATLTSSTGSGTHASWFIGRHDGSNTACRFINSTNCKFINNVVSGRFYVGVVSQNGDGDTIADNQITGVINRGVYLYGASGTSNRCLVRDNLINSNSVTQYGVNVGATTSNSILRATVKGNRIYSTLFHGIGIGGGVSDSIASGNIIQGVSDASGVGIVVELANALAPQRILVHGNQVSGAVGTGIWIFDSYYSQANDNIVSGCGVGIKLTRVSGTSCFYNGVNDNVVHGCTSHGISIDSTSSGTVGISTCNGNKVVANGGWGIIFGTNSTTIAYTGNLVSVNTSGQYSINGTGHVAGNA